LIVVDHSTISPAATRQFAARLAALGVDFLDAPVSGGDGGARAGTLSIMVGGDAEVFARARPVLECLGKTITHVGAAGAGQACKACNQVMVVGNLMAVCESLLLADTLGIDARTMIDVVGAGAGGSWQLANLGPKIIAGDFAPGFRVDLVLKDLAIVADAARAAHLPLAATALAEALFRSVAANGGGELGTQAMATALRRLAGE
jgi:3-hydroxyisobutyrate dehydrogenase